MRGRFWLLALLGIAGFGLLLFLLRGPIALRVVSSAVERNITRDLAAELPDGLHVLLCGAGGPLSDPVRSGPCVAVVAGKSVFVVDAGSGGARNLGQQGLPPGRVDAVLLTHFHSDHIDGLGELAMLRWVGAAWQRPLPVFGPTGVGRVVEGFNRAYRLDAGYRTAHHGPSVAPPSGAGMTPRPFPPPPPGGTARLWDADGVKIVAFSVEHDPVSPAVGYRFDYAGRSVVISGDTRKSDAVQRNAEGVDLLVHEALSDRLVAAINGAATAAGRGNIAKITADIPDYHTTPVEAAEIAEAAGVGSLLYYHVVPPLPLPGLEQVFLAGVSDVYSGQVRVGRDGTLVSLPSGSAGIDVSSR